MKRIETNSDQKGTSAGRYIRREIGGCRISQSVQDASYLVLSHCELVNTGARRDALSPKWLDRRVVWDTVSARSQALEVRFQPLTFSQDLGYNMPTNN